MLLFFFSCMHNSTCSMAPAQLSLYIAYVYIYADVCFFFFCMHLLHGAGPALSPCTPPAYWCYKYACIHTYIYVSVYMHTYLYRSTCNTPRILVLQVCMHTYIYISVYMHTYLYISTCNTPRIFVFQVYMHTYICISYIYR
jgi:hypothetical protein